MRIFTKLTNLIAIALQYFHLVLYFNHIMGIHAFPAIA
jgi:hypothetical protein